MSEDKKSPGRPRTVVTEPIPAVVSAPQFKAKLERDPNKTYAKVVQLGIGVDLLGSALSLNCNKGNTLELTDYGIKAISQKNGRQVLIPWANVRGVELLK